MPLAVQSSEARHRLALEEPPTVPVLIPPAHLRITTEEATSSAHLEANELQTSECTNRQSSSSCRALPRRTFDAIRGRRLPGYCQLPTKESARPENDDPGVPDAFEVPPGASLRSADEGQPAAHPASRCAIPALDKLASKDTNE